ncbi:DUF4292 domain-containing protein [Flavobacterium ardleyense]|uniref:DUF4292 domain-containing protein n=1 Tax=Flavobacterium ardleyense TaxID=2038737 RepID=UPI00298C4545|nr:DUF4292 domain-containing protein [Flavobacterium ardleyense]
MRKFVLLLLLPLFFACKSKATVATEKAEKNLSAEKIIKNHYANDEIDFSTAYIKANVSYKDNKQSQSVTAEIKIKKDEMILVSIRFLGITMAKALITPDRVQYYEKPNSKYFDGDYSTLSKWLGTELNFEKIQNLLLGQPLDNLRDSKYNSSIFEDMYALESANKSTIKQGYYFDAAQFLLKMQTLTEESQGKSLTVFYQEHTDFPEGTLPKRFSIEAAQEKGTSFIGIDYKSVTFNEDFSFPYSAPSGFERINID